MDAHILIREAHVEDLPDIVRLLADDELARTRESGKPVPGPSYRNAFKAIDSDPDHVVLVADDSGVVAGTLQVSFIPNLTYEGGWRAQIEGVRVDSSLRGSGIGRRLVEEAIERARRRGCVLVQLTTDRRRPAALEFYTSLGFTDSHHGMKLRL